MKRKLLSALLATAMTMTVAVSYTHLITGVAKKVEALGMKFGLWIEPEMVNHESRLYREHPDWLLGEPGRPQCHGRNQFVLDYSQSGCSR